MKYLCLLAIVGLIFSGVHAQEGDCGLESQLVARNAGKVLAGETNNVLDTATTEGGVIGQIEGTQSFGVLDGRACADGLTWVEVEFIDGGEWLIGWMVEATADAYFVEPLEGLFVGVGNSVTSVSVVVPPEVASAADVFLDDGVPVDENDPDAYTPASIRITFWGDYPDTDYYEPDIPSITVHMNYAFDNYEAVYNDVTYSAVEGLTALLEEHPDLSTFDTSLPENDVPDFSQGAAMMVLSHLDYLDFAAGSGIRYLTLYAQMDVSPTNTNLLYRYEGITSDGAYFVDSTLPIDAPDLPPTLEESHDGTDTFGLRYSADNSAFFNEIAPEDFTPDLTKLDALIASLWVEGVEGE